MEGEVTAMTPNYVPDPMVCLVFVAVVVGLVDPLVVAELLDLDAGVFYSRLHL